MKFQCLLVLGLCSAVSTSTDPPRCHPLNCLLEKCPNVSRTECENDQLGLFVANGDWCGCCDVCVPYLGENEKCDPSRSQLLQEPHDMRAGCRRGLTCSREKRTCERIEATLRPAVPGYYGVDEESCERTAEGHLSTTVSGHVVDKGEGMTCAPGSFYHEEDKSCVISREERGVKLRKLSEDPESANLKQGEKAKSLDSWKPLTRPKPPRTFRIRWSACDEPKCDRGVCPLGLARKSQCGGRFFPDRHCQCCGECSKLYPADEGVMTKYGLTNYGGEDGVAARSGGEEERDMLTCSNKFHKCTTLRKCKKQQVHKSKMTTCKGMWMSIDPVTCNCCGNCKPFLEVGDSCVVGIKGTLIYTHPGCKEGTSCRISPINQKYQCLKDCPDMEEKCAEAKCDEGEEHQIDCLNAIFVATGICACCGKCKKYVPAGGDCYNETTDETAEPGCEQGTTCNADGYCEKSDTDKFIGPAKQVQIDMLMINSDAWVEFDFPQTDNKGFYYPVQCRAYKCYCVAPDGSQLGYVMPRFYAFNMNCDCARQQYYLKTASLKCDHLGNFQDLGEAGIPRPELPKIVTEEDEDED